MKYRDLDGQFKEIHVKVGDTLPVGSVVDYEGEGVPAGWTEIADKGSVIVSSEEPTTGEEVWIEKGKNLFNINKAKFGWGLANNATSGGFVEDAKWILTAPIPVEAGKPYFSSGFYFANGDEVLSKEFYDKDMNFILYTKTNPMVAPKNAAYMFTDSRVDKLDNPMIIQGTGPIPYEPYKRKIHIKNDNGLYEEVYNEESRGNITIYEGTLLVGGTVQLSNTKRFLDVYFNMGNEAGELISKYTLDTKTEGNIAIGSTVLLAHDSSASLEYYVDESTYDPSTKVFTHKRSGYFNISTGTYTGRTAPAYRIYRIETYD